MRRRRFTALRLLAFALPFAFASCGRTAAPDPDAAKSSGAPAAANAAKLPASLALASEPAGAKPVKDVVASAKSGDEVVAIGRVGVEGSDRAYFSLVDASLKACSETAMNDPCKTPWDFCCTPADELAKLSANVEFRRTARPANSSTTAASSDVYDGNVLGFDGLDHLETVVVVGKAEKDDHGNLTIAASGIFVRR